MYQLNICAKLITGVSQTTGGFEVKRRGYTLFFTALAAVSFLSGCSGNTKETEEEARTVIKLVYSEKLDNLEAFIEAELPDVDLQCERTASSPLGSTVQRRLEAGKGPDLVVSTQPANEENIKYVIPLDGYEFSSRYESTMLNNLFLNDRLYYLPFPGQYNCYVLNKTLFDEAGLGQPQTNDELIADLIHFKENGVGLTDTGHVFGLREATNVTIGTYLTGCMVPDFLGKPEGVEWLDSYDNKQATMKGTWEPAFSLPGQLIEKDLINVTPFSKQGNSVNNAVYMAQGKLAAAYGSSAFLQECRELNDREAGDGGEKYEYVMLPFLGEGNTQNWTLVFPADYIGINSVLKEDGNGEKLDACQRILDALSTQEGQEALMADLRLDNSYLKEFGAKKVMVPEGLEETIEKGYVYYVKFPGKVIEYLGSQGAQFLGGKKEPEECLATVDDYYLNGSEDVDKDLSVVGSVKQDLIYENYNARLEETAIGNLVADSIRAYSGAEIAVANGGGIRSSLYQGEVTGEDLTILCPFDNQIIVVKMTGSVLKEMLENGLSALKSSEDIPGGRFLQVSGIRFEYDGSRPEGERLLSVAEADGTEIKDTSEYTVAITDYMAGSKGYLEGNGDGNTMLNLYSDADPKAKDVELIEENMGTFRDALREYFEQSGDDGVSAEVEGRITDVSAK